MAYTLKTLAQALPNAAILTDAYVCPANTQAAISSIVVCNQDNVLTTTYRISVAVDGSDDSAMQYLYYDAPVSANTTDVLKLGISLNAGDIIRVYAGAATISFNIFGQEITQ